jgi:hypothetical protein
LAGQVGFLICLLECRADNNAGDWIRYIMFKQYAIIHRVIKKSHNPC